MAQLPGFEDFGDETAQAVLEECARLMQDVIAPLNHEGDKQPSYLKDGKVTTTTGFPPRSKLCRRWLARAASTGRVWRAGAMVRPPATRCCRRRTSTCAVPAAGRRRGRGLDDGRQHEQQQLYIPNCSMAPGRAPEPHRAAGRSDLALVRTRAEPVGDGTHKLFGTRSFITTVKHDLAGNIIHFKAGARGAPEGVKGISLFIVPKVLVNADGSGARNGDALRVAGTQDGHQGQPDRRAAVR